MSDETSRPKGEQPRTYLSPLEFSQASGLSLATVHRYLRSNKLPHLQPGGRRGRILIPVDALEMASSAAPETPSDGPITAPEEPAHIQQPETPARLSGPRPRWTRQAGPAHN